MKKILVLAMSCHDEFFVNQVNKIKETWAKDIIDRKYKNIDFMSYDGWEKNHEYDKENKVLHVRCEDDLDNTYKKTYYALRIIQNSFDYDYVFRTNTSTYVNVSLLNEFVQSLENDEILYTSELYSLVEANCPFPLDIYGRGNGLLFSRKVIDILLNEGRSMLYEEHVDDVMIGNVLNNYWIKNHKNYLDYIKPFCHGWFRCVSNKNFSSKNSLCEYWCDNEDYDFWKKFITVQTKMYYSRGEEDENYDKFHAIISSNKDTNISESVKFNIDYGNNDPNVFIGSILGYLKFSEWKIIDKQKLWNYECANKSSNDTLRNKYYKGKPWY